MTAALLALALLAQDARDPDPDPLPPEADAAFRSGKLDAAEEAMRALLRAKPSADLRVGLCRVLLRARKFAELKVEAEGILKSTTDASGVAVARAMLAVCAFRAGDSAAAAREADASVQAADQRSPYAVPWARRTARAARALSAWRRLETEHHVVFVPADQEASLAGLGELAERLSRAPREALDAPARPKIEIYVFADQVQADAIVGWPLPSVLPRERAVYVSAGGSIGHPLALVHAHAAGRDAPPVWLAQGFAGAFAGDGPWPGRIEEIPTALARAGKLPPLADFAGRPGGGAEMTAVAGSFVRWLHRERGAERLRRFWTVRPDAKDPWREAYGEPLESLEAAWRSSIR